MTGHTGTQTQNGANMLEKTYMFHPHSSLWLSFLTYIVFLCYKAHTCRHSGAVRNAVMRVSKWRQITCLDCTKTHRFFGQPHWPHCQCTSVPACIWTAALLSGAVVEKTETINSLGKAWSLSDCLELTGQILFRFVIMESTFQYINDTVPSLYIITHLYMSHIC